ncbi:MAG: hypothetical protein QOG05_1734 [Streptosporangiaceae bacterium]|jgi:hypothetical protein|nr:hypothetical protein [Streptosporangiaceae bacterium]
MTTVHIRQSTIVPLERLVAALIDFGPGREGVFGKGHEHRVSGAGQFSVVPADLRGRGPADRSGPATDRPGCG